MHRTVRTLAFCLFVLLLVPAALFAQKSLHWRAMDVRALLDADGRLHVTERQAMVFTGDWNGGQRIFRVNPGQSLKLDGMWRVDPETGERKPLSEGSLSEVDRYGWTDPRTLRWRSRRASDPPFDGTEIDYEIAYTLAGILLRQGDSYILDNDFAFPQREGPIEKFSLDLELDPVWQAPASWTGRLTLGPVPPGRGAVVTLRLARRGASRPAAVRTGTTPILRAGVFAVLLAAVLGLSLAFRRREIALGRYEPLPLADSIDEAWLEKNVFSLLPEEVGALWDEDIGAPEVAAVLARLTAEGKLSAKPEGKKLTLRRLVEMDRFSGYERELVEALFFAGPDTDTDRIRAHYRSSGFDPAAKIKKGLESRLERHPDFQDSSPRPSRVPTVFLLLTGTAVLGLLVWKKTADPGSVIGLLVLHGVIAVAALVPARFFQARLDRLDLHSLTFLWAPLLLLYFSYQGIWRGGESSLLLLVGVLLIRVGITNNLLNVAKTRDGSKKIARRKSLAAAREFFKAQLANRSPRLRDGWYPYIIAFGLGKQADRWFHAYGGEAAASSGLGRASSGSSSSLGSSGSWTGGGGSFGGAGASASWAVAAGALASGVSAPSSSGGGGGGGGSSGGGGGGGW
jgi:uncharacterized membrane protein YgcG